METILRIYGKLGFFGHGIAKEKARQQAVMLDFSLVKRGVQGCRRFGATTRRDLGWRLRVVKGPALQGVKLVAPTPH